MISNLEGVAESRYEIIINRRGSHRQDACATPTQRKKRELVFIHSCLNKVEQIKTYGHKVDELYPGLSGELCLSSTEEIQIESEEVLAGPSNSLRN